MMNTHVRLAALGAVFVLVTTALHAQVPQLLNYQGRLAVGGVNFNGTGQFKFALVNSDGSVTDWSNDGTPSGQPTAAVSLTVTNGLYSVLLGDSTVTNMTAIPVGVFTNADVRLRVWFNDGTDGWQMLTPDQRLAPNGYLPDGVVTSKSSLSTVGGWSPIDASAPSDNGTQRKITDLSANGPAKFYEIQISLP